MNLFQRKEKEDKIMEGKEVPAPPKPPMGRIIIEGSTTLCKKCGSSIKFGGFLWLNNLGCIQPKCENYYGKNKN